MGDVGPLEVVPGLFKPTVKFLAQGQGEEACKDISNSSMVSALIMPRSATIQKRWIWKRERSRSTTGSRVFTSAVLPGHISQQTGRPRSSRMAPTTICFLSGR